MTDEEKDALRKQATQNAQAMVDALAPLYLGRFCPLYKGECKGPECMLYAPMNDNPQRPEAITGGVCSIPLIASQLPQAIGQLMQISRAAENLVLAQAPRVLGSSNKIQG